MPQLEVRALLEEIFGGIGTDEMRQVSGQLQHA
jgi:hypothetical protein